MKLDLETVAVLYGARGRDHLSLWFALRIVVNFVLLNDPEISGLWCQLSRVAMSYDVHVTKVVHPNTRLIRPIKLALHSFS